MPSPGGQFLSDEFGDIEDYFISDYQLIDQYIGDQLWTWGLNGNGQLGINVAGTTTNRTTPVTTFAGGTNWKFVAGGQDHTAAIKTDGTLWVWGRNDFGQLGVNDANRRSTPVTTFVGGTNWKSVAGGGLHTAAIKTDGTLWNWGYNAYGQLGINNSVIRSTPVTTFAGGTNWKSVACGTFHTASIKIDGTLWCWGYSKDSLTNNAGQLGVNDANNRSTPVTTFAGGANWKSVDCGGYNTLAIKSDGTLWVWGANIDGQLGINNITQKNTPVTTFAGGTNWKSVAGGKLYTTAIKTDGTLWVWGRNDAGQLGIDNLNDKNTPVTTFAGGTNWKSVDCGYRHTLAIKTDGTLWVWGWNTSGQLGINNTTSRSAPVTTFAGGTNWKSVFSGDRHTMAIQSGLNVDFS